jgi:hypothetical protein
VSDTSSTTSGPSVLDSIIGAIKSLVAMAPTDLAEAIGLFYSARSAIQTVAGGVAGAASQNAVNLANATYHSVPLSPAVLATAIVRNVLKDSSGGAGTAPANYPPPLMTGPDFGTANAEALLSGLDTDRFKALVGATGMSYGVIDALRMLNRNTNLWALDSENPAGTFPVYAHGTDLGTEYGITPAEFAEVVAHSDIRPEYIPDLLKLARNSISPADAVEMVVKQVVDQDTGQNLYAAAGGIPDQFAALVAAAGDSLGPEKLVDLLAHHLISYTDAERALGMSRVNPVFYYAYLDAATQGPGPVHAKWLAPYEVGEALAAGHVDAATALNWLLDEGYDQAQASAFVNTKATTTVAKVKEETTAQVLKMYGAKLWTTDQASAELANLGYTAAAITVLLAQAEAQAIITAHNSAVSRVRASYLVGQLTDTAAVVDLQSLGVPQAAITDFISDWHVEKTTPTHHLSDAQVGKLTEDGVITAEVAQAKWVAMGYSSDDAALLLIIYPPPNPPVPGAGTAAVTG